MGEGPGVRARPAYLHLPFWLHFNPLQQSLLRVHAVPLLPHWHVPLLHELLQQSLLLLQL